MKEKHAGGTPEKSAKSKSPDKPQAATETVEKTGATEDSSEKKQSVTKEATDKQGKWKVLWASNSQETDFFFTIHFWDRITDILFVIIT